MSSLWAQVDSFFDSAVVKPDGRCGEILQDSLEAGLPEIQVSASQGKFLQLLVQMLGAKRVLEIGTLGGYSSCWIANGLSSDGKLLCLELSEQCAEVAKRSVKRFGLESHVQITVGDAAKSLEALVQANEEPFDLIFIDADKEQYPLYFDYALKLSRAGTIIVADNVVREGEVCNVSSKDSMVQGVQRFIEEVSGLSQVSATVLQTVGAKGYDGFLLARVQHS